MSKKIYSNFLMIILVFSSLVIFGFSNFTILEKLLPLKQAETIKSFFTELNSKLFSNRKIAYGPAAAVTGSTFRDANGNGVLDGKETLLPGITVNAYDASGSLCGTTISTGTTSPNYSLSGCTGPLRIEFVIPDAGTNVCANTGNDFTSTGVSSVQFVSDGASNVNFGVLSSDYYSSGTNPKMISSQLHASLTGTVPTVNTWSYLNEGMPFADNVNVPGLTVSPDKASIATNSQTGALWGMAYNKYTKKVYMASVLKGHTPLGPEGLDAIYIMDPQVSGSTTKFVELKDDLGINVSAATYTAEPNYLTNSARQLNLDQQNDALAYSEVGAVGLGDIDLSTDGKTLYVVNLFDKKVYGISTTGTPAVTNTYPAPSAIAGATGVARPWALSTKNNQLFLGMVSDDASRAAVYQLISGSWVEKLNFSLQYFKRSGASYNLPLNKFYPWVYTENMGVNIVTGTNNNIINTNQPILSDIEFDDKGNMILGIIDRTCFQYGSGNYGQSGTSLYNLNSAGDILKAFKNSSGNWDIESSSTGSTKGGAINYTSDFSDLIGYILTNNQVRTKASEFFSGDFFHPNSGFMSGTLPGLGGTDPNLQFDEIGLTDIPYHSEIMLGGLAYLPGSQEISSTAFDPVTGAISTSAATPWVGTTESQGVAFLDTETGQRSRQGYILFRRLEEGIKTANKGIGMGDLEILSDLPPIEVGNRVWIDKDRDGIQDSNEPVIKDVTLEFFEDFNNDGVPDGAAIGTSTTNATGNYVFNVGNVTDGDSTTPGNQAGPQPGKRYIIRVASSDWTSGVGAAELKDLKPTTNNVGGTGQPDVRDSDAVMSNMQLQIPILVGIVGENNHTYDLGFVEPTVSIGSTVFKDNNNDGLQAGATEMGITGAVVALFKETTPGNFVPATDAAGNAVATQTTVADGKYYFDNLAPGNYQVRVTPPTSGVDVAYQTSSTPTVTTDNSVDGDDNGTQTASGGIITSPTITLAIGAETTTEAGTNGNSDDLSGDSNGDMTIDFGLYIPVAIGSTVFIDANNNGIQEATETGLANAQVKLYAVNTDGTRGAQVGSTITTNSTGDYIFSGLAPGNYIVGVTPPSTHPTSSTPTATTDNQTDGNDDGTQASSGAEAFSPTIALTPGAEPTTQETAVGAGKDQDNAAAIGDANGDMTVDFGFYDPTTLSVSLLSFNAKQNESNIELVWKTASEIDNNHFIVEKSLNGKEFTQLAKIDAKGVGTYNALDKNAQNGTNYYRLKMVDNFGAHEFSKIVSVLYDAKLQYITVINPIKNGVIALNTNIVNPKFVVRNALGIPIALKVASEGNGKYNLAIGSYSGIYFLTVEGNGKYITKKVLLY